MEIHDITVELIPEDDLTLPLTPIYSRSAGFSPRRRDRWGLLRNVIKAISLFKTQDAELQSDLEDLINEIRQIPSDNIYRYNRKKAKENSPFTQAVKDLRRQEVLFTCVERGSPEDLLTIQKELSDDPYRYLRCGSHPFSLVNKRHIATNQTPLYVAAKNGNLDVVRLLVEQGADHLITSLVEGAEETALEVSSRWGHVKVIEFLVSNCKWNDSIRKRAIKYSHSLEVRKLLGAKHDKSCCRIF